MNRYRIQVEHIDHEFNVRHIAQHEMSDDIIKEFNLDIDTVLDVLFNQIKENFIRHINSKNPIE